MRLSTIEVDSQGLAPSQWSGPWVQRRLIEAYSVERRLPQAQRRDSSRFEQIDPDAYAHVGM
jgi:hypothetical protein